MLYRSQGEMNSPGWCVGHLAVEGDHALVALGSPRVTPAPWDALFLMDADWPGPHGAPGMGELIATMRAVYRRLAEAVDALPAERLAEPSHSDFLRPYLPTRGDWLAHVLTTHLTMHAGGLAAWRRAHGLGPARSA